MSRILSLSAAVAMGASLLLVAAPARADEPPPPPPPETAPAPEAPAPDAGRRVIEMAPPEAPASAPMAAPVPCPPPPCCPDMTCLQKRDECGWPLDNCGRRYGCIDLTVEGMGSWISSPDGQLGETVAGNTDPLEWNSLEYPVAWGGRGTLAWRYEAQGWLELRGTYWGNPDDDTVESGFFGATPGASGTGDLSRPVDAAMSTEAEQWGLELNWWNEVVCRHAFRLDAGWGVRYLSFDERAHVDFTSTGPGGFPVADDAFVDSRVENDFFGFQLCVLAHNDFSDCFEGYAGLKAMVGQVNRDVRVTDDSIFAGGAHSAKSSDDEFVMGFDFEVGFKWRFTPRLALTGGYELLMLDNVQRAEDGMDFSKSTTGAVQARQAADQLVTHAFFLGLSINF